MNEISNFDELSNDEERERERRIAVDNVPT